MILKPIDGTFSCVLATTPDEVLANIFTFNDLLYVETDVAGSQLQPAEGLWFGVNRVLAYGPIANNSRNRYAQMSYDCMLTIATPSDARQEVETVDTKAGQFEQITKELLTLDFINTFKSYFTCCDYLIENIRCRPVWNVNTMMPATNYTGVEINFTVTI